METTKFNLIVTTSLGARDEHQELAKRISIETGVPYVPRKRLTINELAQQYGFTDMIMVEPKRIVCFTDNYEFFFHPAMAIVRIKEIKSGKNDQMIKAMDLRQGYSLLDCTLGLSTDAIVASYVLGTSGYVAGIESSPIVASIVRIGLKKRYKRIGLDVYDAMSRINVIGGDHRVILRDLPENSFDVVYFDPMFRTPRAKSSGINALRPLADHRPITTDVLKLALRVARKRVVVKENKWGSVLKKLGFDQLQGGKNGSIIYGIMVKNDKVVENEKN